ncbi:MAG: hypothetical protein AB7S26_29320 [Sandaracinaceae bacterium]
MRTPIRFAPTLVLALSLATACGGRAVVFNATTPVLLSSPVNETGELRAAIVRALSARRFTTEAEQPGQIIARYSARRQTLRLQIDYSPTEYRLTYLDSTGMGYRVDETGTPVISRTYDRALANLQRSITDELGRPAREAEEALDEQRRHELAVLEQQRRAQHDAQEQQARERERDRQAHLEEQRLATARAVAEANASRPIIVNNEGAVVSSMVRARRSRTRSRFGNVNVSGRVRARWLRGQAEGDIDSGSLGLPESCRGYYAGEPEHVLTVRADVDYLRLETEASGDPTLMLVADDGSVYCDDDGGDGLNSRIEGSFPPGEYRVYVGSYQPGTSATYRLLVTADRAPVARAEIVAPAPRATVTVASPPDCASLVIAMGHSPAATMHCQGAEPHCAEAVLRAGHNPAQLLHCQGVNPQCAVATIDAGHQPAQLLHCR